MIVVNSNGNWECTKCNGNNFISTGTGWSWHLLRCDKCKQLYAYAREGGFIPKEVFNNKNVITLNNKL